MLNRGFSVLMRLFSSSSASASERTTVVSMRAMLADHVADAGAVVVLLEIAADALLQVARLAHVEQLTLGVEIAVDAGQAGQGRHLGQQQGSGVSGTDMPPIVVVSVPRLQRLLYSRPKRQIHNHVNLPRPALIPWTRPLPEGLAASLPPADVWIEAFGCDPPDEMIHALAERLARDETPPVWINLEYLSAEPWVERCHGLPSPVMSGPLKGLTKTFFYPGFTQATGGLLHEQDLAQRQAAFDATAWRQRHGVPDDALAVSLFCYDPAPALAPLLAQATQQAQPVHWLVTPGRATRAMEAEPPRVSWRPVGLSQAATMEV
jgi:hypothetical protein